MRVHVGTDHAGFDLKEAVRKALADDGHEVIDHGATAYDAADDYPAFCIAVAEAVRDDPGSLGIVFGGSGNGEQIAANQVKGTRAILAYREEIARLGRLHNDAHVLSMGGRFTALEDGVAIARVFVETPFSGEERHQRRIDQMTRYAETGRVD